MSDGLVRRIADLVIRDRHRNDMGDIDGLARSMADVGLLHPVVVTPDNVLIAGERRLRAAQQLGWKEIPVHVVDLADVALGELAENAVRKDFLPSEAVAIAEAVRGLVATPHGGDRKSEAFKSESFALEKGRTVDKAAAYVGLSGRTLEKAVAVIESGKPELVELMDGSGSIDRAYKELKKAEVAAQRKSTPLPAGQYRVIYADPPWLYSKEQHSSEEQETVLATHYPSMSTPNICGLPIENMASDNAVLFLWATAPLLRDALAVIDAWGFTYKAQFIWDKVKHNVGHYNSVRHELLLIATRGSCLPDSRELHDSVVSIERTEHSAKPPYFRELIDKMYHPNKRDRIELFVRGDLPAWWERWGNE